MTQAAPQPTLDGMAYVRCLVLRREEGFTTIYTPQCLDLAYPGDDNPLSVVWAAEWDPLRAGTALKTAITEGLARWAVVRRTPSLEELEAFAQFMAGRHNSAITAPLHYHAAFKLKVFPPKVGV